MIGRPIILVAHPIVLDEELQRQTRGRSVPVHVALRSRIILLAADWLQNLQLAAELNICGAGGFSRSASAACLKMRPGLAAHHRFSPPPSCR